MPNFGRFSPSQILGSRPSKSYTHFITPVVLMFLCMFFKMFFIKVKKHVFYVYYSKINVFIIYACKGPWRDSHLQRDTPPLDHLHYTETHECQQLVQSCYSTMRLTGVELATSRSRVRRPNHYTTESSVLHVL